MSGPVRVPGDVLVHLRRARDHLDRHYTEPHELEEVARVAGLSKFHFQRLFTATYGVSPAVYLSHRRIERAQDLLRATNLTVTEVCHAVGFASLGSFSSRFRVGGGRDAPRLPAPLRRRRRPAHPRAASCSCGAWPSAPQAGRSTNRTARPSVVA